MLLYASLDRPLSLLKLKAKFDFVIILMVLLVILLHMLFITAILQVKASRQMVTAPIMQGVLVQYNAAEATNAKVEPEQQLPQQVVPSQIVQPVTPVLSEATYLLSEPIVSPEPELEITQEALPAETSPLAETKTATDKHLPAESVRADSAPITAPRADAQHLNNPVPVYPMLSRRLKEQGTVILQVLILADGSIAELSVLQSSGFSRLDAAAMEAVKKWRFEPARQDGIAITYQYQQPIVFQLQ